MTVQGIWISLLSLATVCCSAYGQSYLQRTKIDLCEKLPNIEPNGEHLSSPGDSIFVYTNWSKLTPNSVNRCLMRFSTCDYCRLRVHNNNNLHFRNCPYSKAYSDFSGWCAPGCTYIHLYDQDYSNQTAMSYSSELWLHDYQTESRFLFVIACSNKSMDTEVFFNLTVTAEDKTQVFKGSSMDYFKSPFFPDPYVLNSEIYLFIFEAATQDEFVTISFDDWHLSSYSTVIFDDANVIGVIQGSANRPWIISNKYRLKMTFETGPYKIPGTFRAFIGFKATYTFHQSKDRNTIPYVVTSCGERITSRASGNITFNPTSNGIDYYDCIWVIQKDPSFEKIMVKVINFSTRETTYWVNQPNNLEIRDGLTSEGYLKANDVPSWSPDGIQTYYPYDSDIGFYVRLKGHYSGRYDFVLVYTSFNYDKCLNLYVCRNNKCIPRELQCNGVDNCGDNSDETDCVADGSEGSASGSHYTTLSVSIIIPLVVSIFLIIVICLLIIFIRRCRYLSRQAQRSQRHNRHISTVSDSVSGRRRHNRRRGPRGGSGANIHDMPPSYEEVLSTTPIGYLNLGFGECGYISETRLIQPPSYEEATSPSVTDTPFSFTSGCSQDLSSDSSSPETVNRSQHHLSTSCSSDDTQAGTEHWHYHHRQHDRNISSSSSDSSVEIQFGVRGQMSGDGSDHRADSQGEGVGQTNTRRSIAKPEDGNTTQSVVSTSGHLGIHKEGDQKQGNSGQPAHLKDNKRNSYTSPTIITQDLSPAAVVVPTRERDSGHHGPSNQPAARDRASVCRVEDSPVVLAPVLLGAAQQQDATPVASTTWPGSTPVHTGREGGRYERPADRGTQHVKRDPRTHRPLRTPMKLLSRSMDDVRRQVEDDTDGHERSLVSSRPLSQSVENIFERSRNREQREPSHSLPRPVEQARPYPARETPKKQRGSDSKPMPGEGHSHQQGAPSTGESRPRPVPRPRKLLTRSPDKRTSDSSERDTPHSPVQQSGSPPLHTPQEWPTQNADASCTTPSRNMLPGNASSLGRTMHSPERRQVPPGSGDCGQVPQPRNHYRPDTAAPPTSKPFRQTMAPNGADPNRRADTLDRQHDRNRSQQYDNADRSQQYSDRDTSRLNNSRDSYQQGARTGAVHQPKQSQRPSSQSEMSGRTRGPDPRVQPRPGQGQPCDVSKHGMEHVQPRARPPQNSRCPPSGHGTSAAPATQSKKDFDRYPYTPLPSSTLHAQSQPGGGRGQPAGSPSHIARAGQRPRADPQGPNAGFLTTTPALGQPSCKPQKTVPGPVHANRGQNQPVSNKDRPAVHKNPPTKDSDRLAAQQNHGRDVNGPPATARDVHPAEHRPSAGAGTTSPTSPIRFLPDNKRNNPIVHSLQLAGGEEDDVYV